MTNAQSNTLVLKDTTGSYFLVPQAVLEQGRVPKEHTAELEQLIAEAEDARSMGGDDTHGYFPVLTGLQYHQLMAANLENFQQFIASGRPPTWPPGV